MKKKTVTLRIDTSGIREASVSLTINGRIYEKESRDRALRSQALLPLIEEVLTEANITLFDITDISIAEGPGSFTGLRVGLSVANILGSILNIQVNGKKTLAMPVYS